MLNIFRRCNISYFLIILRILFGIWFDSKALLFAIYCNASQISFFWISSLILRDSGYSLKPISDISIRIGFRKNFLFSACSLFYKLLNLIISSFYFLLRFVMINCSSYEGSFNYFVFLRIYFIIWYVFLLILYNFCYLFAKLLAFSFLYNCYFIILCNFI